MYYIYTYIHICMVTSPNALAMATAPSSPIGFAERASVDSPAPDSPVSEVDSAIAPLDEKRRGKS